MTTRTLCCAIALTACGGTMEGAAPAGESDASVYPDATKQDSGPPTAKAGLRDSGTTCSGNISFDLTVDASGSVYYGGSQPPWPSQRTCPGWLTIDHAGVALILDKNDCNHSCPASGPQEAGAQSLTWDGTYYPINPTNGLEGSCETPACASPGNYEATFCVAASALGNGELPPTCKTVSFLWPPSTADQVISETIAPTPDGG